MIQLKKTGQRTAPANTLTAPISGASRAAQVLLGLRQVAYCNGKPHCVNDRQPVPVRYRAPRTQFITLN